MACNLNHAGFILDQDFALIELMKAGYESGQAAEILKTTKTGDPVYTDAYTIVHWFSGDSWFIAEHTPHCGSAL